ncbi:hypothetical protein Tco_0804239 [Tanacetum coccineum]|uniref:Transmembrane protein n=1 Tax=Tanacetum coccineum TaxID=301880 RepID=A0ABQ5A6D8_9ASTR
MISGRSLLLCVRIPSRPRLGIMAASAIAISLCLGIKSHGYREQEFCLSPNHLLPEIEDAFSSNFRTYISRPSPDDVQLPHRGKTYSSFSNNSFGLVPIASPTLSLFHNDPYMKVMQVYDAISPPQVTIPPPTVVPPSPVLSLSPMFDSRDFFPPKEI